MLGAFRHPRSINEASGTPFWSDRTVALTGATGSFGRAFVRFLLGSGVRAVRCISRDDHKQAEMEAHFADGRLRFIIADVRERDRLRRAFEGCSVVIHAAALKRVERAEYNAVEYLLTNTFGTVNVVEAALDAGVQRVVGLSTDKASAPVTHYGVTKLAAERVLIAGNAYGGNRTAFLATRYGNVVGSHGSVVPLWLAQKAAGLPLTITGKDFTRFWMSMGEAVALVDHVAAHGTPGTVTIPKLPATRMVDVAQAIAPDLPRSFIGTRGIEKVNESLISDDEAPLAFEVGDRFFLGLPNPTGIAGRYDSAGARMLSVEDIAALLPVALRQVGP